LVVRFLTKRFIGDYERNAGNLYSRQIEIDGEMFAIQVQDTPGVQHIRQVHPGNRVPVVIVANKADLLHIKEVEPQHGLQLAGMLGCNFYEVSVSENYKEVFGAFQSLCKEVSKQQPAGTPEKRRSSLISRPKSPNMQDLKRRFKQALSAKVRTVTSV
ncbi:Ras-like protein family member 11B, partial [Ophiophagus hannah]